MASNYTENYGLNQWEAGDAVLRTDFNADNAKLDAALTELQAGLFRIHTGSYTGTGELKHGVEFPFRPVFLWLQKAESYDVRLIFMGDNYVIKRRFNGEQCCFPTNQGAIVEWKGNTLYIEGRSNLSPADDQEFSLNVNNVRYYYIAIG